MIAPRRFLLSLFLSAVTATQAAPTKLTLAVTAGTEAPIQSILVFDGQKVWEFGPVIEGTPHATHDLRASAWTEANGDRVTLERARAWAADSKQRALLSLERVNDPDQKAFTRQLLEPRFEVSKPGSGLRLDSQFITYVASDPLASPEETRSMFFKYDELNAYRKAMTVRRTPPFVQLVVSSILREHAFVPGHLAMTLRTPGGAIEVVTRMRWGELSSAELAVIRALPQ